MVCPTASHIIGSVTTGDEQPGCEHVRTVTRPPSAGDVDARGRSTSLRGRQDTSTMARSVDRWHLNANPATVAQVADSGMSASADGPTVRLGSGDEPQLGHGAPGAYLP